MRARLLGALAVAGAAAGTADAGVELGTLSPRAIAHAGAALASDDGAAAPLVCPAAIARRDTRRLQLAGVALDDEVALATPDHPRVADGGGAVVVPLLGVQGQLGPVIAAITLGVTDQLDRTLAAPGNLPEEEIVARFPHRYAGLDASWTRRTAAAAVAFRATEWLAIGASLTVAQVEVGERRRLWAGFRGRDPIARPGRDVDLAVSGRDSFVAGAAVGLLIAPLDTPLELAAGAAWADDVDVDGAVAVRAVNDGLPTVETTAPRARARFGSPLTTAVGVRWLGERYAIEGAATWIRYPTGDDAWLIDGVRVVDQSGADADLTAAPTRLPRRAHGSLALAADVAVVPGFLWLTAAYRWASSSSSAIQVATIGAHPGGHTVAGGVELSAGNAVITLGVARQLARATRVAGGPGLSLDNPFPGGTAPANLGDHGVSIDLVGLGLELAMP